MIELFSGNKRLFPYGIALSDLLEKEIGDLEEARKVYLNLAQSINAYTVIRIGFKAQEDGTWVHVNKKRKADNVPTLIELPIDNLSLSVDRSGPISAFSLGPTLVHSSAQSWPSANLPRHHCNLYWVSARPPQIPSSLIVDHIHINKGPVGTMFPSGCRY